MNETHDFWQFQKQKSMYKALDKDWELMIIDSDLLCNITYKDHANIKENCDQDCKNVATCHELVRLLQKWEHEKAQNLLEDINKQC